ncbi:hypothetical protein [Microlunatus kandeliicorticis]|nr:hypothetical protein [Microlunatus kandeliicorticis]
MRYEAAFNRFEDDLEVCEREHDVTALRFLDPAGRRDAAGRPIPHDFVLFDDLAKQVMSVDEGVARVWPLVRADYSSRWDGPASPGAG